ncbi:hypothetical protein F5Y16DRAFT_378147 [Xylariaceae sp. FL0255]|nr:hypothetical protein F5Y16DRAFT_378147 [Xylariaceae sp. FL0255]
MGAKSGFALKLLQWFVRGIQFATCALTLALFSYLLALASERNITAPTWVRAVEGISGIGLIYTALGLLLLCCLAGHPFTSFFAIVIDIAFVGAFIYVAQANRGGASSCKGQVSTPFGSGAANDKFMNKEPTYGVMCRMESAVLAVSIVAIFFFLISAFLEFLLVRHRRKENRFGPSPDNNYTSGYGRKGGFFSRFRRQKTEQSFDPNRLPQHTEPDQLRNSYGTDNTAVGSTANRHSYNKYGESGFQHNGQTAYPETHHQTPYPESNVTGGSYHAPGTASSGGYNYGDGMYNTRATH